MAEGKKEGGTELVPPAQGERVEEGGVGKEELAIPASASGSTPTRDDLVRKMVFSASHLCALYMYLPCLCRLTLQSSFSPIHGFRVALCSRNVPS